MPNQAENRRKKMTKLATLAALAVIGFMLFSHNDYAATARTDVAGAFSSVAGVLSQGPVPLVGANTASMLPVRTPAAASSAPTKH
jgi:hypothetical protein